MPTEGKWDQYLESVRRYIATDRRDSDEIDYKREIGKKLKDARSALLAGKDEWFDLLKQALSGRQGHPMNWRGADNLRNWLDSDRKAGREALRTVWSDGDLKPGDMRAFSERLPYEGAAKGLRSRLRTISVLLMALGLDRYPPYMAKAYDSSFRRLSYDGPPAGADEEDIYWHALAFLDELASRAKKRGLEKPANRLEAQSIVWVMQRWPEEEAKENTNPPVKTVVDPDMIPLAKELYLPVDFLQNIETLIREKKQVIFQGPPGTGKTYVAQKVARHLAGGRAPSAVSDVAELFSTPCHGLGVGCLLHVANRDVPNSFCLHRSPSRSSADRSFQRDAASLRGVDRATNGRCLPWDSAPRYLLRDRDQIYGAYFDRRVEGLGVEQVGTARRSPW